MVTIDTMSSRAQSTVLGALLLVAVGVILTGTIAVLALGFTESASSDPVKASLQSEVSGDTITVRHVAGDPLPVQSTEIVLRTDDDSIRIPIQNLDQTSMDRDEKFTAGESVQIPHEVTNGQVRVRAVEERSGAVLHKQTFLITGGTPKKLVDFNEKSVSDWSGNANSDGSVTITNDGKTVKISGNRWQKVDFAKNVTEDTVMSFSYKSSGEGEIHGIGFETDDNQDSDRIVKLSGTQGWGNTDHNLTEYDSDNGTVEYTIPIGEIYKRSDNLGEANSIITVNDCDGCSNPPTSQYTDIEVYEDDS